MEVRPPTTPSTPLVKPPTTPPTPLVTPPTTPPTPLVTLSTVLVSPLVTPLRVEVNEPRLLVRFVSGRRISTRLTRDATVKLWATWSALFTNWRSTMNGPAKKGRGMAEVARPMSWLRVMLRELISRPTGREMGVVRAQKSMPSFVLSDLMAHSTGTSACSRVRTRP